MHELVEVSVMGLLLEEALEGELGFKVEGSHNVRPLEVLVLILHHVDNVIDLFFFIFAQVFFRIERDVIGYRPLKHRSEGPVYYRDHELVFSKKLLPLERPFLVF